MATAATITKLLMNEYPERDSLSPKHLSPSGILSLGVLKRNA
jgi:hypothetical protein